ncbi:MAG: hypothetical protein PHT07_09205 [Paludibacter sp.]|nr:hypothetical protein [Paludibacter sp.]
MKNTLILFFAFLTTLANAQGIRKVFTRDFIPIAKEYGIDSVFYVSGGLPIYKIDSNVALDFSDFVPTVCHPNKYEDLFRSMDQNWLIEPIKKKTVENAIENLKMLMADSINTECKIHSLDDELLFSLIKKNPDSIDLQIMNCYLHCIELANGYKKIFPSAVSRFIDSFNYGGAHPAVKGYYSVQLNCYELMWTLGKLQSKYFDETKLNDHYLRLWNWKQNRDRIRFDDPNLDYVPKVAILDKEYNSIAEMDFSSIHILKIMAAGFDNDKKCWKYLLVNNKIAYLVLGCQYGSFGGHGSTFKLEIIDKTKLKITEIAAWVS